MTLAGQGELNSSSNAVNVGLSLRGEAVAEGVGALQNTHVGLERGKADEEARSKVSAAADDLRPAEHGLPRCQQSRPAWRERRSGALRLFKSASADEGRPLLV